MNSIIKELKLVNNFLLRASLVLFFPVAPVGICLGIFWFLLGNAFTNKRSNFKINTALIIGCLLLMGYHYDLLIQYAKIMYDIAVFIVKGGEWQQVFTTWYHSWNNFHYALFDLGLLYIIPIQALSITNFFLLRSPELLELPINREKVISKANAKNSKTLNTSEKANISNGSLIGNDVSTNKPVIISDTELNGHLFVAGATGAGKTVTLKNFIASAIERGIPLVYVDGKADQKLPNEIKHLCEQFGREFKLFEMSSASQTKYNPLSVGGFTELKDKIITMKTVDSSDGKFYQTAEGEYLQFIFNVLQKSGKHIDLYTLSNYITMPKLFELVGTLGDVELQNEVRELKDRLSDRLAGLISDINTFIKSELGHLFDCRDGDVIIDLDKDIKKGTILYFSLNDLNYPDYANRIGKLVINDLKSVFGRVSEDNPIKTIGIFDEFTTYAGEQFTTILSRTRSKGMHAIVGSQSFDTIDKISPKLASDLIANCNTFIVHRQNSDVDAEKLADVIGKATNYDISFNKSQTVNVDGETMVGNSHNMRKVRENRVDTEKIQALKDGQAYVLRKKAGSSVNLVQIRFLK